MNSIEFPEMNYKHFREKNAKFHIFLLLSIMGGISLITIYDRKFRHNRPEEGLPKMITYISPINMVAEDNHLYFAYKSPLGQFPLTEIQFPLTEIQFPLTEIQFPLTEIQFPLTEIQFPPTEIQFPPTEIPQRGFMGTIAYNRRTFGQSPNIRSIAGDLPKRIVGLCPLGRA